ncbi:hypothetical protein ABMA27_009340 [Loxostege sticticalis]|uniref:DUF7041 domain-containing protein n=1 Tax=Loxostege sticticalis TaxID=481309 RepID=A0ABR3H7M1_LOXSC
MNLQPVSTPAFAPPAPPAPPMPGAMAAHQQQTPPTQEAKVPEAREDGEGALASITVSSRVPDFWADQPRLWFVQFEAVVDNQKLGDHAKQNLVVTKLSKSAIQQVSDLVISPPATNKYQALKTRLLQVFEESETRQFQKLLDEMELGNQKPSQLLRRMKDLARNKIPDATLQIMWNRHLPPAVQAVLAATEVTDLDRLAEVADKVTEATRPTEIAAVTDCSGGNDLASQLAKLRVEIAELRRGRPAQRGARTGPRSSSRQSKSRPREGSMSRKDPRWLCFYHFRYGVKASKCVEPCNWKKVTPPTPTSGN